MRILAVGTALTNREVLAIMRDELPSLQEQLAEAIRRGADETSDEFSSVDRQLSCAKNVSEYLERCYPSMRLADEAAISAFLSAAAGFPLTEEEVLQIVNLAPTDPVFFHGILHNCDARMTDAQIDRLCALVQHHLLGGDAPPPEPPPTAPDPVPPAPASESHASQPTSSKAPVEEAKVKEPESDAPVAREAPASNPSPEEAPKSSGDEEVGAKSQKRARGNAANIIMEDDFFTSAPKSKPASQPSGPSGGGVTVPAAARPDELKESDKVDTASEVVAPPAKRLRSRANNGAQQQENATPATRKRAAKRVVPGDDNADSGSRKRVAQEANGDSGGVT